MMGRAMSLTTANGTGSMRLAELEWSLQHAVRNHDVGAVSKLSAEFAALLAAPEVKKPTLQLLPQNGTARQVVKLIATNFSQFDAFFELPSTSRFDWIRNGCTQAVVEQAFPVSDGGQRARVEIGRGSCWLHPDMHRKTAAGGDQRHVHQGPPGDEREQC